MNITIPIIIIITIIIILSCLKMTVWITGVLRGTYSVATDVSTNYAEAIFRVKF